MARKGGRPCGWWKRRCPSSWLWPAARTGTTRSSGPRGLTRLRWGRWCRASMSLSSPRRSSARRAPWQARRRAQPRARRRAQPARSTRRSRCGPRSRPRHEAAGLPPGPAALAGRAEGPGPSRARGSRAAGAPSLCSRPRGLASPPWLRLRHPRSRIGPASPYAVRKTPSRRGPNRRGPNRRRGRWVRGVGRARIFGRAGSRRWSGSARVVEAVTWTIVTRRLLAQRWRRSKKNIRSIRWFGPRAAESGRCAR